MDPQDAKPIPSSDLELDEGDRSLIQGCLRMTPAERLASLVHAVEFIQKGREAMRAALARR